MDQNSLQNKQLNFIKRTEKWGPIIGGEWIALNLVVPLALLPITVIHRFLVKIENKLLFDIPGIG